MGGCLWLTPVRSNRREEIEASPQFDTSGDDESANNSWGYRYSSFHWLKGYLLRAGVDFLESIRTQVDERRSGASPIEGARGLLTDAGILAAATAPNDVAAVADAAAAVPAALRLIRSWLREPELDQWGYPAIIPSRLRSAGIIQVPMPNAPGDGAAGMEAGVGVGMGGDMDVDEVLNANIRFGELAKHDACPPALHRVGLRGLFLFAKMGDNDQVVYPPDARVIAASFARVREFLREPVWREMAGELEELFRKCGEDEMSMIQG